MDIMCFVLVVSISFLIHKIFLCYAFKLLTKVLNYGLWYYAGKLLSEANYIYEHYSLIEEMFDCGKISLKDYKVLSMKHTKEFYRILYNREFALRLERRLSTDTPKILF